MPYAAELAASPTLSECRAGGNSAAYDLLQSCRELETEVRTRPLSELLDLGTEVQEVG